MLSEFITFTRKFDGVRWCTYGDMVDGYRARVASSAR
jgi:hypothetical protein